MTVRVRVRVCAAKAIVVFVIMPVGITMQVLVIVPQVRLRVRRDDGGRRRRLFTARKDEEEKHEAKDATHAGIILRRTGVGCFSSVDFDQRCPDRSPHPADATADVPAESWCSF